MLFAESGLFPDYFGGMLAALAVVFAVVMFLFAIGYRVIDAMTPGKLNDELLGSSTKQPNLALAVVVGSLVLGTAIVLGCTVVGTLVH